MAFKKFRPSSKLFCKKNVSMFITIAVIVFVLWFFFGRSMRKEGATDMTSAIQALASAATSGATQPSSTTTTTTSTTPAPAESTTAAPSCGINKSADKCLSPCTWNATSNTCA